MKRDMNVVVVGAGPAGLLAPGGCRKRVQTVAVVSGATRSSRSEDLRTVAAPPQRIFFRQPLTITGGQTVLLLSQCRPELSLQRRDKELYDWHLWRRGRIPFIRLPDNMPPPSRNGQGAHCPGL